MNKLLYIFFIGMLFSCSSDDDGEVNVEQSNTNTTPNTPSSPIITIEPMVELSSSGEWELLWEDEFDTDLNQWNIWEGGAFNNEIQLYQSDNVEIENGILSITANRMNSTGPTNPFDNTPKSFEYVSGRIETKQLFAPSDTEGAMAYRIMARVKLPLGNGMWPAFWTFGDPWPTRGEIDILEARGSTPNEFQSNIFYGPNEGIPITRNEDTSVKYERSENLTRGFHDYELIWEENILQIIFDGEVVHNYVADNKNFVDRLFGQEHKIVLNLAVGGDFFFGTNSRDYSNNSTMEVDWVKVYRR